MKKTTFNLAKMDCAAQEQMVRMSLADVPGIENLAFDPAKRTLGVWHTNQVESIAKQLGSLDLETRMVGSVESDLQVPYGELIVRCNKAK